jgi:putative flippase GtrA
MSVKKFKEKYNLKILSLYGIFGVFTTLINIITYKILVDINIQYMLSNVGAFVVSVIFAYITNKKWVFNSKANTVFKVLEEFLKFIMTRTTTFLFDFFGMIFMVEVLSLGKFYSKIFINIVVIILNYLFSKKMVFSDSEEK